LPWFSPDGYINTSRFAPAGAAGALSVVDRLFMDSQAELLSFHTGGANSSEKRGYAAVQHDKSDSKKTKHKDYISVYAKGVFMADCISASGCGICGN
jgi:hypothetical protein